MTSSPTSFADYWTQQDTQAWLDQPAFPRNGNHDQQERWRRTVGNPAMKRLAQACGQFLGALLEQGRDVFPEHADSVNIPFLLDLRALREVPHDAQAQVEAGRPFAMQLGMAMEADKPAEDIQQRLVEIMDAGNWRTAIGDLQECYNSGERLDVQVVDWKMAVGRRVKPADADPDKFWTPRVFVPLAEGDIAPAGTHHATIQVPSGQLLISDWFRIEAFNALTKPLDDDSLQSCEGRARVTQRYAELGVVHVLGRSPDILASKGVIKAGYLDPEASEDPVNLVGSIHADLRWTTIVDRQHLVDLLAQDMGAEPAAAAVSELLEQNPEILQVQVEPGTHHLYFAGDSQTFARTAGDRFAVEGLYLEDFEEPLYALTDQPLQPAATMRRAPRP